LLRQADATEQLNALRQLGPGFEGSNNPTIRELLDRAAAQLAPGKIATKFPNQPEVQASILRTLGDTYRDIGEYHKALELLTRARDIIRDARGATDPETLSALHSLALAYTKAGKPAKAIELFEQLRDIHLTREDHADTLVTLHDLAVAYRVAGSTPQAIELFEQVLDARTKKFGAGDHATLLTMESLALAYHVAGKLPNAMALFEIARAARVKQLGLDNPHSLTTMHNLAVTYMAAGRRPEAIQLFVQVRDAELKLRGADDPHTITTLNNLALAYSQAGDQPKAIALFEEVRVAVLKKLGPDDHLALTVLNNLALAYHLDRKLPQAIELYEQVKNGLVKQFGADHPNSLTSMNNLAGAYKGAGKPERALPLFLQSAEGVEKRKFLHKDARSIVRNLAGCQEALRQYAEAEVWRRKWLAHARAQGAARTPDHAIDLSLLGINLLHQKKWQEAESELRACLILRESLASDEKAVPSWQIGDVKSLLGAALAGQKDYAGAEPLLLAGYRGMNEATLPPHARARLIEAIERLVALYAATGRKEQAANWKKHLDAAKQ
jgi:tetratricopeptide (TPR) repeat protein